MLAKYNVEYSIPLPRHDLSHHHVTDDPVACEEFLAELIERRFKIIGISHQGVALPRVDFDRMIKTAAGIVMARHLTASLGIGTIEAHDRFGTPA